MDGRVGGWRVGGCMDGRVGGWVKILVRNIVPDEDTISGGIYAVENVISSMLSTCYC